MNKINVVIANSYGHNLVKRTYGSHNNAFIYFSIYLFISLYA